MIFPLDALLLGLALRPTADLDDGALARRIRDGDAAAFKAFFDRHHPALFRYLRRRGVPADVSEDLLQNAFLTLWERRADIDETRSLRALLFRIAHTRALNHFRDTARFADPEAAPEPADPTTPDASAGYHLTQAALRKAIDRLPPRRRAVFELCFMEELTYREAAEALGISVKTVEHQMGRALKAIRKEMAAYL